MMDLIFINTQLLASEGINWWTEAVLGKVIFKSSALQYCVTLYKSNYLESSALRYFCVTFCHLSWACLFIFNNKKTQN